MVRRSGPVDRGRGDAELALELARKGVEYDSEDRYFLEILGLAEYRAGLYREARQDLIVSIERDATPDADTMFAIAMALWQLGETTEARSYYDRGVARMQKTGPKNPFFLLRKAEIEELFGLSG